MKVSELMIGNLVKINNDLLPETHGKTYSVYKLQITFEFYFPLSSGIVSLTDKVNMYTQFDQFIEPIPLTEEWLLKFGFEISRSFNGSDAKINDFDLWKGDGWDYWEYSTVNDRGEDYNEVNVKIKHVHQLQNLVFALTGEELTLNDMP